MKTNILATAAALSDKDLLARLAVLADRERDSSVELVAHLAALGTRPALYAAQGYGSLYAYCTHALRLSEDAACYRIAAARACRSFPVILDLLASGEVTLTAVHLLRQHLTPENYQAVLKKAAGRSRRAVEALVAELAPQPDVPTSVRKLPTFTARPPSPVALVTPGPPNAAAPPAVSAFSDPTGALTPPAEPTPAIRSSPPALFPPPRPVIRATAPERYRLQCTIGEKAHDRLRRLQQLLRREIPDGDPGVIVERALALLFETVEKKKCGAATRPQSRPRTRSGTGKRKETQGRPSSRHVPRAVSRAVWRRDGGQCAFVSTSGRRCPERTYLDEHHVQPYARQGPATVANISLRRWRHNQYEAELVFGPRPHTSRGSAPAAGRDAARAPRNVDSSNVPNDA